MPRILVDADACPVKDETYRVAERYGLTVIIALGESFVAIGYAAAESVMTMPCETACATSTAQQKPRAARIFSTRRTPRFRRMQARPRSST